MKEVSYPSGLKALAMLKKALVSLLRIRELPMTEGKPDSTETSPCWVLGPFEKQWVNNTPSLQSASK